MLRQEELFATKVIVLVHCASGTLRGTGVSSADINAGVYSRPLLGVQSGDDCVWDCQSMSTRNLMGGLNKPFRPSQDSCEQEEVLGYGFEPAI